MSDYLYWIFIILFLIPLTYFGYLFLSMIAVGIFHIVDEFYTEKVLHLRPGTINADGTAFNGNFKPVIVAVLFVLFLIILVLSNIWS